MCHGSLERSERWRGAVSRGPHGTLLADEKGAAILHRQPDHCSNFAVQSATVAVSIAVSSCGHGLWRTVRKVFLVSVLGSFHFAVQSVCGCLLFSKVESPEDVQRLHSHFLQALECFCSGSTASLFLKYDAVGIVSRAWSD